MIIIGDTMYQDVPERTSIGLPAGKTWVRVVKGATDRYADQTCDSAEVTF